MTLVRNLSLLIATLVCVSSCATTGGSRAGFDGGTGSSRTNALEKELLGRKPFSLQWISWDDFGEVLITKAQGKLTVKGEQKSRENDDYLLIDGVISEVTEKGFVFNGLIETQVDHNNGGAPYRRQGRYTFFRNTDRGFWRLVEMHGADRVADYVDIYFSLETAHSSPD